MDISSRAGLSVLFAALLTTLVVGCDVGSSLNGSPPPSEDAAEEKGAEFSKAHSKRLLRVTGAEDVAPNMVAVDTKWDMENVIDYWAAGDAALEKVLRVHNARAKAHLALEGVHGVSVGRENGEYVIRMHVDKGKSMSHIPERVDGVRVKHIPSKQTTLKGIVPGEGFSRYPNNYNYCGYGTYYAGLIKTNSASKRAFISAAHVLIEDIRRTNGVIVHDYYWPAFGGGVCEPASFMDKIGSYAKWATIDCDSETNTLDVGQTSHPDYYSLNNVTPMGDRIQRYPASSIKEGEAVQMYGATSGFEWGEVVGISAWEEIGTDTYGYNCNDDTVSSVVFTQQLVINMNDNFGDSGSAILNVNEEPVGLLMAGNHEGTVIANLASAVRDFYTTNPWTGAYDYWEIY